MRLLDSDAAWILDSSSRRTTRGDRACAEAFTQRDQTISRAEQELVGNRMLARFAGFGETAQLAVLLQRSLARVIDCEFVFRGRAKFEHGIFLQGERIELATIRLSIV
jgi:hypothetical protein